MPADLLDLPVDYESLAEAGSIMGSGGMVVMDDTVCMVDVARYFMDFCRDESCGKCVPCRVGTTQLHVLLTRISRGHGEPADLDRLGAAGRRGQRDQPVRPGPGRAEPGAEHAALLPRGVLPASTSSPAGVWPAPGVVPSCGPATQHLGQT